LRGFEAIRRIVGKDPSGSEQCHGWFVAGGIDLLRRARKKTAKERADSLDQACGADTALRLRVEKLLESHPLAMDFLAQPAVDRDPLSSK
jgi:hypothetical protein